MTVTLYDFELSGNCYKLRLLLNFLKLPHETVPVDFFPGRENRAPWFLRLNPFAQLPVLTDGDLVLADSAAILAYLARKYDASGLWFPEDPAIMGEVLRWHGVAHSITATSSAVRFTISYGFDYDVPRAQREAHIIFRIMDAHLAQNESLGRDWLCSPAHPTTADIACFPYVMLSDEAEISREPYPALRRWTDRFRRLPGFITMPGIPPIEPATAE